MRSDEKLFLKTITAVLFLFIFGQFEASHVYAQDYQIKRRFNVDSVEASFPVDFAQLITTTNHYIAYYDKNKNLCVAYRKLDDTFFQKTILNSKIGWDSHNYIVMILDEQGFIHISGNMHSSQLYYWRSKRPFDASEFEELHSMTGAEEDITTYPDFIKTNSGQLLFHYRYGHSGDGYEIYNIWNPLTKSWSRFLDKPLIDGEGQRNAYMKGPFYESDGYYHLYWVWRETPDAATNHSFSYARSKDLKKWEGADGTPVANPMLFDAQALKVDPSYSQYGTGILNGVQAHILDSKNRLILFNMKYDDQGNSQFYAYRKNSENKWEEFKISNWNYRYDFSGYGSLKFEIYMKGVRLLANKRIGVSFFHSQIGNAEIILDEDSLYNLKTVDYIPSYPMGLEDVTTKGEYSKPINVHINQSGNYILRWETMGQNNDLKPSGVLPGPFMLELIEIQEIGY